MTLDEIKILSGINISTSQKQEIDLKEEYGKHNYIILQENFNEIFSIVDSLYNITNILKELKEENLQNLSYNLIHNTKLKQTSTFILSMFLNEKKDLLQIQNDLIKYKEVSVFESSKKSIKKEYLIINTINNIKIYNENEDNNSIIDLDSGFVYLLEDDKVVIKKNNKFLLTDITKENLNLYEKQNIII